MTLLPPLKIRKLTLQMNGSAQNGGSHFEIPCTLPGEVCIARKIATKGKTTYALPEKITKRSESRIPHDCMHFTKCGGCHLRHVDYKESVYLKEQVLRKALEKYNTKGLLDEALLSMRIFSAEKPTYYRNTARFYIQNGKLTQHEMLTHEHFEVKECRTITFKTIQKARALLPLLPESVYELEIKENAQGEQMCILRSREEVKIPSLPVESVYCYDEEKKKMKYVQGTKTLTHTLEIQKKSFTFAMGPDSFFQVHTQMAEVLYTHIAQHVPSRGVLFDLFSGTGTIGIIMSLLFPNLHVKCIEKNEEMVALAEKNAKRNKAPHVEFIKDDVFQRDFSETPDCILIDPPRKGMTKPSLEKLMALGSKKIIYVSCHPVSFMRDMEILLEEYTLTQVALFDMIPYTSHMEIVSIFEKKNVY